MAGDAQAWAAGLLQVLAARTTLDKDARLAALSPPEDGAEWGFPSLPERPGRPPGVIEGVPPRRRKGVGSPAGLRRFLHAIWHIEMEAIDLFTLLALRGAGMPQAFHADCVRLAREEAVHAGLLAGWLETAGFPPGSEPVHHRLWLTASACPDLPTQLVAVPRFLEARGLDVNAAILPRVREADAAAHAVLERIYHDEIGHVAMGTRWHAWWCARHGLDRTAHFADVVRERFADQLPSPWPLDRDGRALAGFHPEENAVVG